MTTQLCPDDRLAALVERMGQDDPSAGQELERLMLSFPDDARLAFLSGSLLAAEQNYAQACDAMRRAVALAPDYAIARFQLGFLLLTCGEPYGALEAWGPLHGLPTDNYLRIFADGLTHLIHDRFPDAIAALQEGIALNKDNPPMNADMRLIIEEARQKLATRPDEEEPTSPAHMLLQQAALKSTRH